MNVLHDRAFCRLLDGFLRRGGCFRLLRGGGRELLQLLAQLLQLDAEDAQLLAGVGLRCLEQRGCRCVHVDVAHSVKVGPGVAVASVLSPRKISAMPDFFRAEMSASGMMPPTITVTSFMPFSRRRFMS